jgi:PPOX class probable F420-dependent enzyme
MPICFAVTGDTVYFTIDEKPKRKPAAGLKCLANVREKSFAALVVDRYDENWTRLAWLMLQGRAEILHAHPEHDQAQTALRARYPQLAPMRLDHLPVVAIRMDHATSWGRLDAE